jgi:hypothetical protein
MATIKAKFNDLKNEKIKLSSSIKLQSKKVELCKEDLQIMLFKVGGMTTKCRSILVSKECTDRCVGQSKLKS